MQIPWKRLVAAGTFLLGTPAFASVRVAIFNDDPLSSAQSIYVVLWDRNVLRVANSEERAVDTAEAFSGEMRYGPAGGPLASLEIDGVSGNPSVDIHCSRGHGCSAFVFRR